MSAVHQGVVLHPSCVPGKVGINKKLHAHEEKDLKKWK
jgi:hypothetical protein